MAHEQIVVTVPAKVRRVGGPPGRARPFFCRNEPGRPAAGILFFDRQSGVIRPICARERPDPRRFAELRATMRHLRAQGMRIAMASHHRGDGWEQFDQRELALVNARVESALGPFDVWAVCLVGADGVCACREPRSGALAVGSEALGAELDDCLVVTEDHRLLESAARLGLRNLLSPSVDDVAGRRRRWDPLIAQAADDLAGECQQALDG